MLLAAVVAAACCTAFLFVLVPVLRSRAVLDHPGSRSSHTVPTPRGGGLAVVAALCLGALVADRSGTTLVLLGAVLAAAAVGLAEDLHGVAIRWRLIVHALAAAAIVSVAIGDRRDIAVLAGAAVLVVFVVAVVNAVNFMDGINGISAVTGLAAGLTFFGLGRYLEEPSLAAVGVGTAAVSTAFLPWNAPRARVFLGDVGSYGLGAALAGCVVLAVLAGATVEAAVAPVALYLADTGTVLIGRLARGERLGEPHRQHAYQRLTDTGLGHTAVSAVVLLCTAAVCGLGLISLEAPPSLRVVADSLAVIVLLGYLTSPSWRRDRVRS